MATSKQPDHELNGAAEAEASAWPDPRGFKRSIRTQFAVVISLLTVLLVLVSGYGFSNLYISTVTNAEIDKLLVAARSFSAPTGKLMITGHGADELLLQNVCKRLKSEGDDIYWVGVANAEGHFKAHTDIAQVIDGARTREFYSSDFSELLRENEHIQLSHDTLFVSVPISENNAQLGTLSLAASGKAISEARNTSLLTVLALFLVMLPLSALVPTLVLRRQLKPIKVIADGLKSISYENARVQIPYSSRNEFGFLAETLRSMGDRLESTRQQLAEQERMARELEIAREVQMSILPRVYPGSDDFSTAAAYRSAKEVGGDYYDFINLGDGRHAIIVADVSGKSLPGMLMMLMTRDLVKSHALSIDDPKALLCHVNSELKASIREGMFVTMIYGILDSRHATFNFASAGHNPLAIQTPGDEVPRLIKTKGFPLAMFDGELFNNRIETHKLTLQPGEALLLYTDVITEAQNNSSEEFGVGRLTDVLRRRHTLDSVGIVRSVISEVDAFVGNAEQYDDITLVAIKWEAARLLADSRKSQRNSYAC